MSYLISDYVTDKLINNCVNFGILLLGVLFGVGVVVLAYKIFANLKAKPPKLNKKYREIPLGSDQNIKSALDKLHSLDIKSGIDIYIINSSKILVDEIKAIACEYTGGKKYVSLNISLDDNSPSIALDFDADFEVEDFLVFLQEIIGVIENTILTVTDKYYVLVNSFLRFIGLGTSIRDITLKDLILFLNQKAVKKDKKLTKVIERQDKKEERKQERLLRHNQREAIKQDKRRELAKNKKNADNKFLALFAPKNNKNKNQDNNKFLDLFKPRKKENNKGNSKDDNSTKDLRPKRKKDEENSAVNKEDVKLSAFYKPINKIITEVMEILIVGVYQETRKLYGRGYAQRDSDNVELSTSDDQGGDE